jgi:hypothetical protein
MKSLTPGVSAMKGIYYDVYIGPGRAFSYDDIGTLIESKAI